MGGARVFSGIQPSGELHLGNYFGAIQNWVKMQDEYDCIYCVVDLHAITSRTGRESDKLQGAGVDSLGEMSIRIVGDLIACGIDPERSIVFVQSHVPQHTELTWIFSCIAAYGDLTRMTQFKDKADQADYVSVGLFTYPVLQAADILLYKASKVPVGEDQVQHLELARRIGRRYNMLVGEEFFPEVEPVLTKGKRIMSLVEPSQKMSKSLGSKHYVGLMEDPDSVWKKIRSAVTDTGMEAGQEMSPGVANLFGLLRLAETPAEAIDELEQQHAEGALRYGDLKAVVQENLMRVLDPIRERRASLGDAELRAILKRGAERASDIARETIADVDRHLGIGALP